MPSDDLPLTNEIMITVNGSEVSDETLSHLITVVVEQQSHLPGLFTIRLFDPDLQYTDNGPFDLASEIEISFETNSGVMVSLIKGEVTALEPRLEEGDVAELVVTGYDKSHRLYRETKSQSYLNIKDSDLASQFAGNAGLGTVIDTTSTVYEHIYQDNQSDLAFLMQRAWRIGYECFVDDGKLYFREPPSSGSGVTLNRDNDLVAFRPRLTLAEQVDEVSVRGWDPMNQTAIVGQASSGHLYPSNSVSGSAPGQASSFGTGKLVIVDQPVISQAEANTLAQARLDEISGAMIEAEGVAFNRPDIRAGQIITLEGVGTRFSGDYLVTSATHVYANRRSDTTFTVRGLRTGSLVEQTSRRPPLRRWQGVVPAVVTNADDPDMEGRVKLKYPWLSDDVESWWARVVSVGAGPGAGLSATPEVGDEVLVAFEHGDFNRPYVLGGLWSGAHATPAPSDSAANGEQPLIRTWCSRDGHSIAMFDNADKKVEIVTTDGHLIVMDDANKIVEIKTSGGHTITLDDQGKKIAIESTSGHKVTMDDNARKLSLESGGDVQIKATGNMKLEANGTLDLNASGPVNVKGAMVNLN